MITFSCSLGAQILRNQYPEQPPLAVITALTRLGIESNRAWMACTGTAAHAASTRYHSSSRVVTGVLTRRFQLVRALENVLARAAVEHFLYLERPVQDLQHAVVHYPAEM